jgi:hypothetical protein
MLTIACATLTCWVCVLITTPRKPLPGNEVQEFVYSRLLSRRQWLVLLALLLTGVFCIAVLASAPQRIDPNLRDVRSAQRVCNYPAVGFPSCYRLQADGTWAQEEFQDGQWIVVRTGLPRPSVYDPYDDPATLNR